CSSPAPFFRERCDRGGPGRGSWVIPSGSHGACTKGLGEADRLPSCKPVCKPDALKRSKTRETDLGKRTRPRRAARGHCIQWTLPKTAGSCVVRLMPQRPTACPLRARWSGKRRALTVTRGQEPALATWADAGHSRYSLSLPSL